MTIPTEVAAVLAEMGLIIEFNDRPVPSVVKRWKGIIESALTAKAEAVVWQSRYRYPLPNGGSAEWHEITKTQFEDREALPGHEKRALYAHAPPAVPVESLGRGAQDPMNWAQGLISQLPANHDGRNSWILNHGVGEEADWHRAEWTRYTDECRHYYAGSMEGPKPERRRYPAAEPVASVPDGWREDVSLAAQMLTWGRDEGLSRKQMREIDTHAEKLFAMIATPPTNQEGAAP